MASHIPNDFVENVDLSQAMKYEPTGAEIARIERDYTYHAPKPDQIPRFEVIRDTAKQFAALLLVTCPDSRERSLALTSIETAVMQANASIARNE